jgi:DNA (cytosine-5)-methyltransferase 3A
MNVLGLFDGISGGQVALNRIGIQTDHYFASEIDESAVTVTQYRHPNTIQLGDVIHLCADDLPQIDLLLGGSPCQGFSFAGKQLNFDDPRSKLFFEYVRLLRTLKPIYFLLENVQMKKEYLEVISEMVGVQPVSINSKHFSAQDRKRLYWTNIPLHPLFPVCDLTVEDILEDEVDEKYYIEPQRTVKILEDEVRRRKIAYIGTDNQSSRVYRIHNKSVTLCGDAGGLGAKMGLYAMPCLTPERMTKKQNGRRFKPPHSKFYTLTAQDKHGILIDNYIRKLTPLECERLQTLPDHYTDVGLSDNQRYKLIGNGWTIDVIAWILKGMTNVT